MNDLDNNILCLNTIRKNMKLYKNIIYEPYNLNSAQINILMGIKFVGPMRRNEIASYINIEQKVTDKYIDLLIQQDYLEKQSSNEDRRAIVYIPTKKTEKLYPYFESVGRKYATDLMNGMSDSEKIQWNKLLQIAADNSASLVKKENVFNKKWVYINTDNMSSEDIAELARLLNAASVSIEDREALPNKK